MRSISVNITKNDILKILFSIILLEWRLGTLALYFHHDLAILIPAIRCWCFPYYVPYGYLWYLVNWPLSFNYPLLLALVDFLVQLLIVKRSVFYPYLVSSYIIYLAAPYDLSIMWISLTGPVLGLIFALAAKLPDTLPMWAFLNAKRFNVNDLEYYAITAVPWLWLTTSRILQSRNHFRLSPHNETTSTSKS